MKIFIFLRVNILVSKTLQNLKAIFGIRYFLLFLFVIGGFVSVNAQVLDSAALAEKKVFTDLKEALQNPDEVYRLCLKRKKLSKFPADILKLKNLNELDMSRNKLVKIPAEISQLSQLQVINLSNNNLTGIPPEIGKLTHLRILILNNNKLQSLPPEMGQLYALRVLDIWGTEVDVLPYELSKLKHTLERLDMRVIYMNRKQQEEILKWFPNTEVLFSKACNCQ